MKNKFRSLELIAKKYLESYSSGIHATLLKDSLVEVDVVREYQPGDKRLDSRSSFKTGRSMSRVFNPERSLNLFIILDLSSSQFTKLDAAITTALYLCYLGEMCGEKIGLCIFSNDVSQVIDLSEDYSSVKGAIEKSLHSMKMNSGTSAAQAIAKVSNLFLTNSLVVMISDFCYNLEDSVLNCLKKVATVPTNSFLNIALYNPDEWLDNIVGNFTLTFRDAETGSIMNVDTKDAKKHFQNWSSSLKKKLLKTQGDLVFLNVKEERFLLPLIKYLMRV